MLSSMCVVAAAVLGQPPAGTHVVDEGLIHLPLPSGEGTAVDLYYPNDLGNGPYPLVSFAHGMFLGGAIGRPSYYNLMHELASHGMIVVAPRSCMTNYCDDFWKDQLGAINACHNTSHHNAFKHINFEQVGVIGHAMGGQATEQSAEHSAAYNLRGAVAMNPISEVQWAEKIQIPIFYSTGSNDDRATPAMVKAAYEATASSSGTMYANLEGAGHYEPTNLGSHKLNRYAALFLRCHVAGDASACTWVGPELCTMSGIDFAECLHK